MSVINDTLKNLDKQQKTYQSEIVKPAVTQYKEEKSKRPLVVLMAVALVSVGAYFYLQINPKVEMPKVAIEAEISQKPSLTQKEKTKIVERNAVIEPSKKINRLKGFQLKELENGIELEFKLDQEPVSFIKEYLKNKVVYHLANVSNKIQVPRIENKQWIHGLNIKNSGDGLDLMIESAKGTLLNTRWDESKGSASRWILSIIKKPSSKVDDAMIDQIIVVESKSEVVVEQELSPVLSEKTESKVESAKEIVIQITPKLIEPTAEQKYSKAEKLISQKNWQQAILALEPLLNSSVDSQARQSLIHLYQVLNQLVKRRLMIRDSVLLYPNQLDFSYLLAKQYFEQQRYLKSVSLLQGFGHKNYQALALLGQAKQRLGQHEAAIGFFRQSLQLKQQPHLWVSLAISLEKTKHYKEAITAYNKAITEKNISQKLKLFSQQRSQQLNDFLVQ